MIIRLTKKKQRRERERERAITNIIKERDNFTINVMDTKRIININDSIAANLIM